MLDKAGITEQRAALCGAAGHAFYNTSKFTLRDLKARANQQQLRADFEAYLDGFSSNVQDILTNFEFRNIIPRLSKADALGTMIAKFLDPEINLSPNPVLNGEGENAEHVVGGAEWSTLSHDAFPAMVFDFELTNPPYGKSWKKDLEAMGGKDGMRDPRFKVTHKGEELNFVTRSSDGQLLFLANMVSKMNSKTKLGSRIAEVHNGSSLFTGDAGQGESNIRRWIIENDWLEAIIALPLNMFDNTGIATYIWVLSNKKTKPRRAKVQLIDATQWFKPLRKNLGKKNCELSPEDIQRICDTFMAFQGTEQSKIFANEAFGYQREVALPITYRGKVLQTSYRADFLCYGEILVKLKALQKLSGTEESQVINYLKASRLEKSLLINFGAPSLEYKRLILTLRKSAQSVDDEVEYPQITQKNADLRKEAQP